MKLDNAKTPSQSLSIKCKDLSFKIANTLTRRKSILEQKLPSICYLVMKLLVMAKLNTHIINYYAANYYTSTYMPLYYLGVAAPNISYY